MSQQYRYTISQTKKMEKLIQKTAKEIMEKIGQDTVNKLKMYIRRYWYDRYSPQDYDRTFNTLNAVSYKVYIDYVKIYIDEDKLVHAAQQGWGQHIGFDGEDFSTGLIEFIENGRFDSGKVGYIKNPKINKGSGALQKTTDWLNKYVNREVKHQLSVMLNTKII